LSALTAWLRGELPGSVACAVAWLSTRSVPGFVASFVLSVRVRCRGALRHRLAFAAVVLLVAVASFARRFASFVFS
jgi:hypothetical protein